MGRGQRHSKNAGIMGSEALTYHERKALGFGTVKERLGKVGPLESSGRLAVLSVEAADSVIRPHLQDSQGNYYDCCLTLQPAVVSLWDLAWTC